MIAEHISLEYLPRILSNKPLLEHFLSALLDKAVQLPCWPKEMPWDFCYPFADLYVRLRGKMLVSLSANLFDPKHLVDELRLSTGVSDPTCSIVISDIDIVGLGQSYCRIVPMAVGDSETRLTDSCWQIHILSSSRSITTRNAPSEIQQLLDHMAGMKIQPEPDSLLDRMLHEDFAWSPIADMRSNCKANIYACCTARLKLDADRRSIRSYAQSIAENAFSAVDLSELYAKLTQLAARNLSDTELQLYFHQTGIPAELYRDALDGITWDVAYLHVRFDQALQEEAERRRAAVEQGGKSDGSV